MKKHVTKYGTMMFCDESKFYVKNGDAEDAIYYFGIAVVTDKVAKVNKELNNAIATHGLKIPIFHSTTIFRENRPRIEFMNTITQIIIDNNLQCFCYKYYKPLFFEPTKYLKKFNNEIINFENHEFQAVFYFLIVLNTYLRDGNPDLLKKDIMMYFDRNVYGKEDVEAFDFPSEDFVISGMTFVEKSLISLLALPDFFGYIFRKSKISQNKVQFGDGSLEKSRLTICCYDNLLKINRAKLFTFLDVDSEVLGKALKIDFQSPSTE